MPQYFREKGRFAKTLSPVERFWDKVEKTDSGCWEWQASCLPRGYGRFGLDGVMVLAHRYSYELAVGPIPDGLQIDHLCSNPRCVRPSHLEAVTARVNLLRGDTIVARAAAATHCPQGHPYAGDNLVVEKTGKRKCRACRKARDRRRYERGRA